MSGNGAWYGGDDQQPAASRNPSHLEEPQPSHSFAEAPTAEQPLVPQPRAAADNYPPVAAPPAALPPPYPPPAADLPRPYPPPASDLPPPFPPSMYSEDGDVVDPVPPPPVGHGFPGPGGVVAVGPAPGSPPPGGPAPGGPGRGGPAHGGPAHGGPAHAAPAPVTTAPRIGPAGSASVQLSTIEVTTDSASAVDARLNAATETAPAPRNRRDLSAAIAIAIVILMVACVGVVGSSLQVFTQASDTFETGNCVAPDAEGRLPYQQVACSDPAFTHMVVGVLDRDSDRPCRSVPGASTLFSTNATVVCLAVKGADGTRSINIVREGDCVNINGENAVLIDCRDPSARYQVLKRLTDVPEGTNGPCAGVEGLIETYQWNWKSSDPVDESEKNVDVVLCLGPSQSAIDAEAAARAAQSTCRFLSDAEVSAAVSAATGKTYTVSERVDDGTHCAYQFSKPNEIVRVGFFSGAKLDPKRDSAEFTIDGLRAAWDPGRGNRSLGVEVPAGTIYIKVQLSGVGDVTSRKLAIDAFKSARSRIK